MVGTFSQKKSRLDKKNLQRQLDKIDSNRRAEKRALKGISQEDAIFQSELLKRISLVKAVKRKRDPLDFTSGTLRGL